MDIGTNRNKGIIYQDTVGTLCHVQVIHKTILIYEKSQCQYNLSYDTTLSRMTQMLLFLFPPCFPTSFCMYTYSTSLAYPFIPICPIINNLLPLETRRIKQERGKKPTPNHEPHTCCDQDISNITPIRLTKDLVHEQQNH